jgi:hypothetical protein
VVVQVESINMRVEVKVTLWYGYAGKERKRRYSSNPFASRQHHASGVLTRERPGTHCKGGWVCLAANMTQKTSPSPGIDPRTVQLIASRHTVYIIHGSKMTQKTKVEMRMYWGNCTRIWGATARDVCEEWSTLSYVWQTMMSRTFLISVLPFIYTSKSVFYQCKIILFWMVFINSHYKHHQPIQILDSGH